MRRPCRRLLQAASSVNDLVVRSNTQHNLGVGWADEGQHCQRQRPLSILYIVSPYNCSKAEIVDVASVRRRFSHDLQNLIKAMVKAWAKPQNVEFFVILPKTFPRCIMKGFTGLPGCMGS